MKVHRSALKHGVSPDDAIHAAQWSLWIEPLDEDRPPNRELRLGFDTSARLLETVVLIAESGEEARHPRDAGPKEVPRPPALMNEAGWYPGRPTVNLTSSSAAEQHVRHTVPVTPLSARVDGATVGAASTK